MRTNIVIPDVLMSQAMALSGMSTKREVVEQALTEFVENRARRNLSELKGKILFAEDYEYKTLRAKKQK